MSQTSIILERAAKLVERGWTQGRFEGANNTFCAVGALMHASIGEDTPNVQAFRARAAVEAVINRNITEWNDAPERTQKEVVEVLRTAAKRSM